MLNGCGKKQEPSRADGTQAPAVATPVAVKAKITLSGAWALYPMAVKWAEEYGKLNPNIKVDISAGGAGKGMADALAGAVDLGMVSREINQAEKDKGAWWVSVVKDAVLPTINEGNPAAAELFKRGLTRDEFRGIWVTTNLTNWAAFASLKVQAPLHVYTRSDACGAAETWAKYLGANQEDLKGTGVYGDPGLAEAVRKDPLAVGFNNLNFAYDLKTGKPIQGIRVIPIDINGNQKIDPEENFYGTLQDTAKAIADGRYPSPPARALHLVSNGKPAKKEVVDFLRWVLTDGQKFVMESGYINLPEEKIKEDLKKLD
jgi:phosphate transport system substrate-binding protein